MESSSVPFQWFSKMPDAILVDKADQPLHELGSPTVVLRTIIEVDHHCRDVSETLTDLRPPLGQSVD